MADGLARLLRELIEGRLVSLEQKEVQRSAGPRTPGETIAADQNIARERERHRAAELAPAFEAGLRRAYQASRAGQASVTLDDRREDENAMADALIQFLVRPDLARAHTEPSVPNHYVYQIAVDWPQLARLAAQVGVDLDAELAQP